MYTFGRSDAANFISASLLNGDQLLKQSNAPEKKDVSFTITRSGRRVVEKAQNYQSRGRRFDPPLLPSFG